MVVSHASNLFEGCREGDLAVCRRALKAGAMVNERNAREKCYPLHMAATGTTSGHVEVVKLLCEDWEADETVLNEVSDILLLVTELYSLYNKRLRCIPVSQ